MCVFDVPNHLNVASVEFQVSPLLSNDGKFTASRAAAVEKAVLSDIDIQNLISSGNYAKVNLGTLKCAVKRAGGCFFFYKMSLFTFCYVRNVAGSKVGVV